MPQKNDWDLVRVEFLDWKLIVTLSGRFLSKKMTIFQPQENDWDLIRVSLTYIIFLSLHSFYTLPYTDVLHSHSALNTKR